jgi:hypothetical protein
LSGAPTVSCSCAGATTSCSGIATGTTCNPPFLITVSASMPASAVITPLWSGTFSNSATYEVRIQ